MEQFSLEKYLENPNRKVVTRAGRNVRIICTDRNSDDHPIIALLQGPVCENTCFYRRDGLWLDNSETPIDLLFAPEKKSGWINVYRGNEGYNTFVCNRIFATKEEAQKEKRDIIATIKIEWEE